MKADAEISYTAEVSVVCSLTIVRYIQGSFAH